MFTLTWRRPTRLSTNAVIIPHQGDGPRHFEYLGRFDHPNFAGIQARQRNQGVSERHQVRSPAAAHNGRLIERDLLYAAAAYGSSNFPHFECEFSGAFRAYLSGGV